MAEEKGSYPSTKDDSPVWRSSAALRDSLGQSKNCSRDFRRNAGLFRAKAIKLEVHRTNIPHTHFS